MMVVIFELTIAGILSMEKVLNARRHFTPLLRQEMEQVLLNFVHDVMVIREPSDWKMNSVTRSNKADSGWSRFFFCLDCSRKIG